MRLRNSVAAALGALTLLVTLPASASADTATGEFEYSFIDASGQRQKAVLTDPDANECIVIPVAPGSPNQPVFAPGNFTTRGVDLHLEADCTDEDDFVKLGRGQRLGDETKFRAVIFNSN